ncbi:hypothetical protein BHM03_00004265 [Ensete ventricosum]|uniref:Uncharacterized protein n=1 Tax=Ensete ventricosum TaxID=4639 RepID=A0A445MAM9_ENSVE|nr:hypothetical protein BHM03_00004265 [Ensete ventricosum]
MREVNRSTLCKRGSIAGLPFEGCPHPSVSYRFKEVESSTSSKRVGRRRGYRGPVDAGRAGDRRAFPFRNSGPRDGPSDRDACRKAWATGTGAFTAAPPAGTGLHARDSHVYGGLLLITLPLYFIFKFFIEGGRGGVAVDARSTGVTGAGWSATRRGCRSRRCHRLYSVAGLPGVPLRTTTSSGCGNNTAVCEPTQFDEL